MKKITTILLICFLSIASYAQKTTVADKFFKDFAYLEAAELYKEALTKGDSTLHILTRIGDCFYNNSKSEKAAFWYGKAANKYKTLDPVHLNKYIQTLTSLGKYEEASIWFEKLRVMQGNVGGEGDFTSMSLQKYEELTSSKDKTVDLINLNSNSRQSDFGAFELDGKFYFSSSRTKDILLDQQEKRIYKWNEEPFLNMYQSDVNYSGGSVEITDIIPITSDRINLEMEHEGTLAITKDGETLYFTRNNVKRKRSYDKGGTSNLKLYRAKLSGGKWINVQELPFNDRSFSTGHPALSPDEKTLYFVSDREGGYGQSDLYKVAINSNGSFGAVSNLGQRINTAGREMFPFVAKDNTLYFSSDSHLNLGLLDIFESDILQKENTSDKVEIKNLGAPYNSGDDDFAYFLNSDGATGYFSSNRPGGRGSDDIYAFGKYECKQIVNGFTFDKLTAMPLGNVTIKLMDESGKVIDTKTSASDGAYVFMDLECEKSYSILATKIAHRSDSKKFTTTKINGEDIRLDLFLTPLIIDDEIVINPIFFDYDKSNIRPDAAYELENVVKVMRQYPKMIIKIESHTDSRGRDSYNMKLSDRRAKSTRDYIESRGIENRIESAIGFGESELVNRCDNAHRKICSEDEHQENRRSKFIITNPNNYK